MSMIKTKWLIIVMSGQFHTLEMIHNQVGEMSKAQKFAEVSYGLVCLAKGKNSSDAQRVASLR